LFYGIDARFVKRLFRCWFAALAFSAQALAATTGFVGSHHCANCHAKEMQAWRGSHHDLAMAEATAPNVLGDFSDASFTAHGVTSRFFRRGDAFFVHTDGPDGELRDYQVRYTFGWYPLQQYLVELPRGRLQVLGLAWDSRPADAGGQRWFHLYPDEPMDPKHPLHWTGREQNWNYQCAECHSTNLRKHYRLADDSFATDWSEIDVACEACHGPGSAHVAWAESGAAVDAADGDKGLLVDLADRDGGAWLLDTTTGKPRRSIARADHAQTETCARCHSRRGLIWDDYVHGRSLGTTHRLALLEDHLYFADGQIRDEVFVHGSFIQSRMYRAGVTCSDCHEPHSLALRADGNAVCARCHVPARYDDPAHHHHEPGSAGAACTACHMPERIYMVVDRRADHSLRIPRPDLSVALGTPNACNGCHADRDAAWAADAVAAWFPDPANRGEHFAYALHAATTSADDAADRLARLADDAAQPAIARATALDRLRPLARREDLAMIERLLQADDTLVRAAAVRFLDVTEVRTRVDLGWPLLDDAERLVRLEAARVLAPLLRQRLPERFRAQLTRAVEEYGKSQFANAERPESHLNLGLVALAVGDLAEAENAYRTALRLDSGFAPAYANLADLYRETGRDSEGETLLRAGIAAVADDADLRHALGLLLVRAKRLDEALPHLQSAAELSNDGLRYGYVYGLALHGAGDTDAAIQVLTRVSQGHPGELAVLRSLRDIHRERGDAEQMRHYEQLLGERQVRETER
jgi:predicted CXXCH cytochrome family protein